MRTMQRVMVALLLMGLTGTGCPNATAQQSFEVATIKPSAPGEEARGVGWENRRFMAHFTTLSQMMQFAYNVQSKQIIGAPAWFDTATFDIEAQAEGGKPTVPEWRQMMQNLLAERLGLKVHHEQRVMPAYVLLVAKSGPKLDAKKDADKDLQGMSPGVRIQRGPHMWMRVLGMNGSMPELAAEIQRVEMDRPVVDKTGLTGRYNFSMTATSIKPFFVGETAPTEGDAPAELFTAIQDQLGLKLEPTRTAVDCLVLDRVDRPVVD